MELLSPRENFATHHKASAEELSKHVRTKWLSDSTDYVLAQIAFQGATAEQLKGARTFVEVFHALGEKTEAPLRFPKKQLEMDEPVSAKALEKPEEKKA